MMIIVSHEKCQQDLDAARAALYAVYEKFCAVVLERNAALARVKKLERLLRKQKP